LSFWTPSQIMHNGEMVQQFQIAEEHSKTFVFKAFTYNFNQWLPLSEDTDASAAILKYQLSEKTMFHFSFNSETNYQVPRNCASCILSYSQKLSLKTTKKKEVNYYRWWEKKTWWQD
jgi:hypothetical protein